jgi:hypothetical protein
VSVQNADYVCPTCGRDEFGEPFADPVPPADYVVHSSVLAKWLRVKGYAEEEPGYGHVDALTLAEELLRHFDIRYAPSDRHG